MESKKEIYDLIPAAYYPRTILFRTGSSQGTILEEIRTQDFKFPLVGKPDIGMKGLSVKKLDNREELLEYAATSQVDFLVQEFVSFKNEAGIFYYRLPNEKKGHISGIVRKEFLTVTGDGTSTIEQLLKRDKRYILQLPVLRNMYKEGLDKVIAAGEEFLLVPYGNHVRGAKFVDDSHLADEELTNTIDAILQQVRGFYYGRMDIKFNSWDELKQEKNFSIIELNGAGSEPTHMYDPKHSIFFAWKEIIRHLAILGRISRMNHHPKERPYMDTSSGLQMLRANSLYVKMITDK